MSTMSQSNSMIISNASELNEFNLSMESLENRKKTDSILMCEPTFFDVVDVKNDFMAGQENSVDKQLAKNQWSDLKEAISKAGFTVTTISGVENLEDMVFSANQVLVGENDRFGKFIVPSRMKHSSRQREIPYYINWFEQRDYKVVPLENNDDTTSSDNTKAKFEGHGDAIWHPERKLLWGGYGYRTDKSTYSELAKIIDSPIILLELINPTFYHLDTCFSVLNKDSVMIYPGAFSKGGLELIRSVFTNVYEVDEEEAANFACNALGVENFVFIQKGSNNISKVLRDSGFKVIEVDTSEFMKSGGSVFCLTLDIYS